MIKKIIRLNGTKRIIEIGSGFSTFAALDTIDKWGNGDIKVTCIEPYPDRLYSRMTDKDRETLDVIPDFVHNVNLSIFDILEKGDILFIDSSHVTKSGGDIPFEYFNILPRLKPGVIIHIHDIYYPFDYPKDWLVRGYTEAFILRALLTDNRKFRMLYFGDYLRKKYSELYMGDWKKFGSNASIWLEKN